MLEDKLEEMTAAIEANTEILQKLHDLEAGDTKAASVKRIGDMEKAMHEEEDVDAESEKPKPASKKKASKKKARNKKPAVTIEMVKAELSAIDRTSARAVLKAFNVEKLKDLQPEDFEAAITEAQSYAEEDDLLG